MDLDDDMLYDEMSDGEIQSQSGTVAGGPVPSTPMTMPSGSSGSAQSMTSVEHIKQDYKPPSEAISSQRTIPTTVSQTSISTENGSSIKTTTLARIENILANITSTLLETHREPVIYIKRRRTHATLSSVSTENIDTPAQRISFPGKTPQEAWRFSVVVRILSLIRDALKNDVVTTKRDMYYKDPALFMKQAVVDRYVDDIAFTLGVPRATLHVAAAAKGLCAGAFSLRNAKGAIQYDVTMEEPMLISELQDADEVDAKDAEFILVIEKEATFQTLVSTPHSKALLQRGILITGKGYPDIATRAFLQRLSKCPKPISATARHIYALVDYDPDGISILSTYKYGSRALPHENESLVVPSLKWMGLKSSDVLSAIHASDTNPLNTIEDEGTQQGLLQLSARDRSRAISMLKWPALSEERSPMCRRELQVMLMLGIKAEIQFLDSGGGSGGMIKWLSRKLNIT